ncbi:MAG: S41 family peptidase [Bacteroidota bacterium]
MKRLLSRKALLWLLLIPLAFSVGFLTKATDQYFEISKNMEIFGDLYKEVNQVYVDETNPTQLMRTGLDAMLGSLDPYTNYYSESQIDQSQLIFSGQYSGIGAEVGRRKDAFIILELVGAGPADEAGIRVGDEILNIDEVPVSGSRLTLEEVNNLLMGEKESEVRIRIRRSDGALPLTVPVKRQSAEVIQETVSYSGMINDSIGYVLLANFTGTAGQEVNEAIQGLQKEQELKGMVLDLRSNPGGRLDQAVDVSNLFLPQGELIVEMKGRAKESKNKFYTRRPPLALEMPLAILLNGRSASASEIVAGSIQDLDRGVIVGQRSFGKGLVQNVRPLNTKDSQAQMKVTLAKYYTPSGRCIQAIDYAHRNADGSVGKVADSLIQEFQTRNGRKVYDGGGVDPDWKVDRPEPAGITRALIKQNLIFDFANQFSEENDSIASPREYELGASTWTAFLDFVKEKDFQFETQSEQQLAHFQKVLKREGYQDELMEEIKALQTDIQQQKSADVSTYQAEIQYELRKAILQRYYFKEGVWEASFVWDPDIQAAVEVLADPDQYRTILEGSNK